MVDVELYKEVISIIVMDEISVLGKRVVDVVNKTEGLKVDAQGFAFEIAGDPVVVIEKMLGRLVGLMGRTAVVRARFAIKQFRLKNPDVSLPLELCN